MGFLFGGFGVFAQVSPAGSAARADARVDASAGVGARLAWPAVTAQTKPWTRWWWMGSAVDRENLSWNMEEYAAAGLGGLELTPIYGVKGYESQFIDYLSPAWMGMFGYTLKEAKRLGLGIDMSTGTGWPFGGGPLIDSSYACKELFYKVFTVHGGERLLDTVRFVQEPLVHTDGRAVTIDQLVEPVSANKDLQGLALFQVRYRRTLPLQALMGYSSAGEVVDLTGKVGPDGHLEWVAPVGSDWTIYGVFQGWHGKMVERAAPGAEGNVIDHFSGAALKKYLSRFDTAFAGQNLAPLRCFFNDSYEVDDSRGQGNWTPGFFESFKRLRGYDLRSYLPALFGGKGGVVDGGKGIFADERARVLCDYRETISDLLLEQFTRPWGDWAHSKGALIRNQAHGAPANIFDLYAVSDIPETEGTEILRYKFGTSAAHVVGKGLASAEAVTWLDEHFLSSYSDVKTAVDGYFLGGVNHIFYHGTAYTPKKDVWPGWLFYAAVHFTPNDPAWKDFSVLNGYVTRVQSFLQEGASDNDVLLYWPLYDSWMEGGAGAAGVSGVGAGDPGKTLLKHYDRIDPEFSGTGFKTCAELLLKKGYGFDYISDKQLQQASFSNGYIATAGSKYRTIVVPDVKYLSVAAMESLVRLAEAGIKVIFYKNLPVGPPGYGDLEKRKADFKKLLKGDFVVGNNLDSLLSIYGHVAREVMVDDSLDFVRRSTGDGHVYFIVNHGSKAFEGNVTLVNGDKVAAIFDAMTGRSGMAQGKLPGVYLQLQPGESCVVRTSMGSGALKGLDGGPAGSKGGKEFPYYKLMGSPVEIKGEWTIEFVEGGPKLPGVVRTSKLDWWINMPGEEMKSFSGAAVYTISFSRPTGHVGDWLLDLGKVSRTAEVFLNGAKVGGMIGPDYRLVLRGSDLRTTNELKVRVASGMLNRVEDMERNGVVWKKFYNTNFPAHERGNRGADGLFDARKLKLEEAGLVGPIILTALLK